MVKTLIRYGDDYALEIDSDHLAAIQATPETQFDVRIDGRSLILTPVPSPIRDEKFREALRKAHERFGEALKKLAE